MKFSDILGVRNDLSRSNYLGLPSLIARSKKRVFGLLLGSYVQAYSILVC